MSLSFGWSPWLLAVAVVAAALLAYWLYRHTVPTLPTAKRALLTVLRFSALVLVLFLLFQPILRLLDRDEKPAVLAVLIDDSQSLLLTAGEDTSGGDVRAKIRQVLDQLPETVREAEIRFFSFGENVEPVEGERFVTDSLAFDGTRTNIARALDDVRERLKDENLSAALLLSDGQYNTGRNPLYSAERYPVPIYTAVLGDTSRHRDIQIRHVTTNEIAYVGTELPVQVGIRTEDMGGEQVAVSLLRDGALITSTRVSLPEGSTETTVDLSVTPDAQGLHRYTVSISRLPGEATYRNNSEAFTVRVLDSKRRILIVAAAPGPDVAAILQTLQGDETFEISSFVQKAAGTFYEGAFPANLEPYDAVVLAGYPGKVASRDVMARIAATIQSGTPVLFHLTRDTHLPFVRESFGDALPLIPDRVRTGYVEAAFVASPSGMSHPVMAIPNASPEMWKRLPPLLYSQSRWQATPDAEVLARIEVRGVQLDDPLFAIRRRSSSRSAALVGAGTWRWKNVPEDLEQLEHIWPTLMSNTLQWLTAREDDRPVRVVPVRDLFGGGEAVQFTGQVYNESLSPVSDATVEVRIEAPDGTVSPYTMNAIGNGRYTLDAGVFPEGTYQYQAVARKEEVELGSDAGAFAVGALTLEFKETSANAALMRQIAQRSGGAFLEEGSLEPFRSEASAFAPVIVEQEREIELRRRYIFLALIIILLTAEWFVRKRSGMV